MKKRLTILFTFLYLTMYAQTPSSDLPYAIIPDYPATFTPENLVTRMIDGLGFRFYWASEGLSEKDMSFKMADEARSIEKTLDHILGLSQLILNTASGRIHSFSIAEVAKLSFTEKRKATLIHLKMAADIFRNQKSDLDHLKMKMKRPDGSIYELPFWNLINGPIADAIWHSGQIVTLRRASGNPINPKVNVLLGKLND